MKRLFSLIAITLLTCFCLAPDAAKDLKPGLLGEYYDMGSDAVEDFPSIPADKKPTIKLIDKKLDFESTSEALEQFPKLEDHFACALGRCDSHSQGWKIQVHARVG